MKNVLMGAVVLVVVAGSWYILSSPKDASTPPTPTNDTAVPTTDTSLSETPTVSIDDTLESVTVTYTANGFVPTSLSVAKGTVVIFINESGKNMWIGADEHPTHTGYDSTSKNEHCPNTANTAFDQCAPGASYTFIFTTVGTWGYHNHVSANHKGIVVVTE